MAIAVPDVLVLGAGGVLGEAWMRGVLSGAQAAGGPDFRACEYLVGTSAGSIVAATLSAGRRPEVPTGGTVPESALGAEPSALRRLIDAGGAWGYGAIGPATGLALRAAEPVEAMARAAMLARIPRGGRPIDRLAAEIDGMHSRFDERLRIVCVERASGRRVVFGERGAPAARVGQAVQASCAIPGVFAPVRIEGREYVDGGVWSLTNLDVAPARRGQQVLCLNPTGRAAEPAASLVSALARWSRARVAVEQQYLRTRGVGVRTIAPDRAAAEALGPNLMDPRRAADAADVGYQQALRLARE
jgi:NTE family protein